MYKIWAKTIANDRVKKSLIYKCQGEFERKTFGKYIAEICEQLDIPTPIVLKSHIRNFDAFHMTRFLPSDFVESVDFDSLTVEYCVESGEKKYIYKSYLPVD